MKTPGNKKPQTGLHEEYFRDGTLSHVGKCLNGKKTGEWKIYDKTGKLVRTKQFGK